MANGLRHVKSVVASQQLTGKAKTAKHGTGYAIKYVTGLKKSETTEKFTERKKICLVRHTVTHELSSTSELYNCMIGLSISRTFGETPNVGRTTKNQPIFF